MYTGCRPCIRSLLGKNITNLSCTSSSNAPQLVRQSSRRLHNVQTRARSPSRLSTSQSVRSPFALVLSRHGSTSRNSSSITSEEDPAKYCQGGYHPVHLGEIFNERYKVVSKLGYGIYSTVWLVEDLACRQSSYVALKILTADSYGSSDSVFELDILQHIKGTDVNHPGYQHVVHLLNSFTHDGPNGKHLCLVTELMGPSVMDLQRSLSNKRIPVHLGRQIARQILCALDWLGGPCGIIHTDIKPNNILLELPDAEEAVQSYLDQGRGNDDSESNDFGLISRPISFDISSASSKIIVKIIDFGVASWKDKHLTDWIQPPSLRAPEVFLGAPWDASVDVWSTACVIYELLQGRVLFRGRPGPKDAWTAEEDQLAQMIELFGPIPASLRNRGKFSSKYLDEDGNPLHIKQLYPCSLKDLLKQTSNASMSAQDYSHFETFLRSMLEYESSTRKTPKELLKDPWLLD